MPVLIALLVFGLVMLLGWRVGPSSAWAPRGMGPRSAEQPPLAVRLEAALKQSGLRLGARPIKALVILLSLGLTLAAYRVTGNLPVALVLGSLAVFYPLMRLRQWEEGRREQLALQFKEALTSITYSLRAGTSLGNALEQALTDLHRIHAGHPEPIVEEFEGLVRQCRLGVPVEVALAQWADRVGLEDVQDFVSATLIIRRRGGNLSEVIERICETISWKIVAQVQLRALTAEKRSEANILITAPAVVLALLSVLSPHYVKPLFVSAAGQTVLFIGVVCNVLAFFAVRKVLESPL